MLTYIALGTVALVLVLLGGFLVKPQLFPAPETQPAAGAPAQAVQVPDDLPIPVKRWLHAEYPDGMPVHRTLRMRGLGVMRFGRLEVPFRHQLEAVPGEGFVRRMDLTWYGLSIAHGLDTFVAGKGMTATPVGTFDGAKVDQGANVVNWLEALAVPAVLVADERVRWEGVDSHTARLIYPFGTDQDEVVITFDPGTGAPVRAQAMRYKDADAAAKKLVWTATMEKRRTIDGLGVATRMEATWEGASRPWATFEVSDAWSDVELPDYEAAVSGKLEAIAR